MPSGSPRSPYECTFNMTSASNNLTFTFNINLNTRTDNPPQLSKLMRDDDTVIDIKRLPEVFDPLVYGSHTAPVRSPRPPPGRASNRNTRSSRSNSKSNASLSSVKTAVLPRPNDEPQWNTMPCQLDLPQYRGRSTNSLCEAAARSPNPRSHNRHASQRTTDSVYEVAALPVQFGDKTSHSSLGAISTSSRRFGCHNSTSTKPCESVSTAMSPHSRRSSSESSSGGTSSSGNTTASSSNTTATSSNATASSSTESSHGSIHSGKVSAARNLESNR